MSIRHKFKFLMDIDIQKSEYKLLIGPNNDLQHAKLPPIQLLTSIFRQEFLVMDSKEDNSGCGTVRGVELTLSGSCSPFGIDEFKKIMCNQPLQDDTLLSHKLFTEVLGHCNKFLNDSVTHTLCGTIAERITIPNCVVIYETCKAFYKFQRTTDAALEFIFGSIGQVLATHGKRMSYGLWETVLLTEGPKAIDIEEDVLFTRLVEWRNWDRIKNYEDFEQLVRLIRFPLMPLSKLSSVVGPTNVLNSKEMTRVFAYVIGGGSKCYGEDSSQLICHRRKHRVVHDSESLSNAIQTAKKGDLVKLLPGEYSGSLIIKDKVVIQGSGINSTVMSLKWNDDPAFKITGHYAKILDLAITMSVSKNEKDGNVNDEDGGKNLMAADKLRHHGLIIEGGMNLIKNVAFNNCNLFLRKRYDFTTDADFQVLEDGLVATPLKSNCSIYLKQV